MPKTTTTELVGQRVKVIRYAESSSFNDRYVGLTGLVVSSRRVRDKEVYLVLLDNDPDKAMEAMLGGLPCYDWELEVINA